MLDRLRYHLRAVFRRAAVEREMREEMREHLDRRVESLVAQGMHQDAGREARRTQWVDALRLDVHFALRYFARKPLASATIVLVLALGIGGESVQLSVLQTFIQRPPAGLPEDVPLVRVRGMYRANGVPAWHDRSLWYGELRELADLPNTFTAVAGWTSTQVAATVPGALDGDLLFAEFVTPNFFRTIGVRPTNGPGLAAAGDASQPVGIISYGMWEDVFDRGAVAGRVVTLNGIAVRVAGVAPPDFNGPLPVGTRRMMWLPLSARAAVIGVSDSSAYASLDSAWFQVVGRLAAGVSPARAAAAAHVVAARVAARMLPRSARGTPPYVVGADVVALRGVTSLSVEGAVPLLLAAWMLLTILVLAIVCTNVGGLVIGAGVLRQHEIGVRLSLGASRARLIRQLLTESTLLAVAGGGLGLLVFRAGVAAASRIPEIQSVRPDLETVGLTMLVALGTAVLFGLTPALHATRQGVAEVLKRSGSGATRRSRLHQAFVIGQVVAAQPLLVLIASMTTTLMIHDPSALPANVPDHVLRLGLYAGTIPGSYAQRLAALDRLSHRLDEIPGVAGVVPDASLLRSATLSVRKEDRGSLARANDPIAVDLMISKPGYFRLLSVPLLRGNDLPADTGWTAVIGSDLARALWGASDPIGRRLQQVSPVLRVQRDIVVTGVYDATRLPSNADHVRIYSPVKEWPGVNYLIRTEGPAVNLADTLRRIARAELPSVSVERPTTLAQLDAARESGANTGRRAAAGVAGLVLLLSSIGLYGIVALSVGQRQREIGVRMALGARASQVVSLFYKSGLALGALGLVVGLPIGLFAAHFLPALEARGGISEPRAPSMLLVGCLVSGVVLVVTSIATLIPASRAATVDPVAALRVE
jgi:putative ABC transport system permease protein